MDTTRIEKIITEQFSDPHAAGELQDLLAVIAEREGATPGKSDLARAASFIYDYIEQVPYLLTVALTSARNVGLESEMKSIFKMVEGYWVEDNDVIPDNLGIIGLLDDAYCSLQSMQALSDFYQLETGKFLFPDDLTTANEAMRRVIGEPYATELDTIVSKAVAGAHIKDALKLLASPEKQQLFSSQATIWNHGPAHSLPVEKLSGLGLTADLVSD